MSSKIPVAAIVLVLAGSRQVEAQDTAAVKVSGVPIPRSGMAVLRGDRLDVVFPRIPLADLGCEARDGSSSPASGPREFSWAVMQEIDPVLLADANYAFMPITTSIPRGVMPTFAALDSALAKTVVWVRRVRGEPPMLAGMAEPTKRAVYFDHEQLHVVTIGAAVIEQLLPPSRLSLEVRWCGRGKAARGVAIPVDRD